MTFIPVAFDEIQEPKAAPGGNYPLQILEAKEAESGPNSKNPGSPQIIVTLGFSEQPDTPNIRHYISLPTPGDEKAAFKGLLLKRFLEHFRVPYDATGIETDRICMDMVGCEAVTEVKLDEPDANGTVYNRIQLPKLRSEAQGRGR